MEHASRCIQRLSFSIQKCRLSRVRVNRGDWLTGVYPTREIVQVFSKFLDDPLTHISPPLVWEGWEAYYHIMNYEGTRSADVK
jgi:hypothetical protein